MAQQIVMTGAMIKLYVNNKLYKEVQSLTLDVDYGETETYGIDVAYAQEIATTKVTVRGSVQGIRIKYSGGLQAASLRPLFNDIFSSPYVSIRIQDRSTGEDIVFIPNAKVTRERHMAGAKQKYSLNWDFVGQIPYFSLDRS